MSYPESSGLAAARFASHLAEVARQDEAVAAAQAERARAEARLMEELQIFKKTATEAEVLAMAYDLRWFQSQLNSSEVARALGFGSARDLSKAVGPLPTGQSCARCGDELLRYNFFPAGVKVPEYEERVCQDCGDLLKRRREYRRRY